MSKRQFPFQTSTHTTMVISILIWWCLNPHFDMEIPISTWRFKHAILPILKWGFPYCYGVLKSLFRYGNPHFKMGIQTYTFTHFDMVISILMRGCSNPRLDNMGAHISIWGFRHRSLPVLIQGLPYRNRYQRIPILKWWSLFWNGDTCVRESPYWNGDPHFKTGFWASPYQNKNGSVTDPFLNSICSNFGIDVKNPQIVIFPKTGCPYQNGTPQFGTGRWTKIFQFGESPCQIGE